MTTLLRGAGVTVRFGALVACDAVDIDIVAGEILGIIGPNGSGKSTLLRALSSVHPPTQGSVFWHGREVTGWKVDKLARHGLVMASQNQMVFGGVTVREALAIAHSCRPKGKRIDEALAGDRLVALVGLEAVLDALASDLPLGYLRRLGIGIALAAQPELLLLDEPGAGLNDFETRELKSLLLTLRDLGVTVGIVDHDMTLMVSMCDRVVVLDAGKKLVEGPPQEVMKDPRVIEAYLGTPMEIAMEDRS
ncbi:ABC transporter ATP-binding protein [Acrocarpospora catenulata]|uniref:ABC transporter ATP-binding protein n=1 Tax=Acrocarpospora catenulata TaxID=2836182 RepID=UPI001BDB6B35|nr:ATP-binding cassette domain-containing protein [Acrocarpospora catenulata]